MLKGMLQDPYRFQNGILFLPLNLNYTTSLAPLHSQGPSAANLVSWL
jgi:hypothetical protein